MFERLLITAILLFAGYFLYRTFKQRQLAQLAAASAGLDPVLRSLRPGVPAIVYFTTPHCAPCETQQFPALVTVETELGENVQIVKIDATEDADAAERWGVMSVPTTFIVDGEGITRDINYGVANADKLKRQIMAVKSA